MNLNCALPMRLSRPAGCTLGLPHSRPLYQLALDHSRFQLIPCVWSVKGLKAQHWVRASSEGGTIQPSEASSSAPDPASVAVPALERVTAAGSAAAAAAAAAAVVSTSFKLPDVKLVLLITICLILGVCNRVAYKAALGPMKNYLFFLAQLQNFGYLITYFTVLGLRYKSGIVTSAMLSIDKRPLMLIGVCEAVAQILLMIGASHLPGVLLPIVSQSMLLWNFAFASLVLGTKFSVLQVSSALLVMSGVILAGAPPQLLDMLTGQSTAVAMTQQIDPFYVSLCVLCFAFPALASIIKERLFRSAKEQLGGQPLDIFVVNSFGSLFQAICVLLLLPITCGSVHGIALSALPEYLSRGVDCMRGLQPACGSDCSGAPLLPLAYVVLNLCFNIGMLTLLRSVGTVTLSIIGSCLVPLTVMAFMLPFPFLEPSILSWNLFAGTAILTLGLALYNYASIISRPKRVRADVDKHDRFSEAHVISNFRGVSQYPSATVWRAHILGPRGKVVHLGVFDNEEDAARAYDAAARATGRSPLKSNFPSEPDHPPSRELLIKLYGTDDPTDIVEILARFVAKRRDRSSSSSGSDSGSSSGSSLGSTSTSTSSFDEEELKQLLGSSNVSSKNGTGESKR